MDRFKGALLLLMLVILFTAATSWGAGCDTYFAVKGGVFLPNGHGASGDENGFSNFSQGYNGEVAIGIRPESYAAVELGAAYYRTDASVGNAAAGFTDKYTASAIPVTLTVKGILPYGRLEAFAGAGIGYWAGRLQYQQLNTTTNQQVERNLNAGAFGYQAVAGADYRVTRRLDLGAEAKWASAKPEFDFTGTNGRGKEKWEFGGTTVNFVLKWRF